MRSQAGSLDLGWRFLAVGGGIAFVTYLLTTIPSRVPQLNLVRLISVPRSVLGGLVAKNLRELFGVLDTYLGFVLALVATVYRFFGKTIDGEAYFGVSLLIVLAFSTMAQSLLALDGPSGFVRYQLMPVRGWQILLAKDLPLMAIAVLFTSLLAPLPALAGMFAALAVGHHPSVVKPRQQKRWRFAAGASLETSILQIVLMLGAGTVVHRVNPLLLGVSAVAWALSLGFYGYVLDRERG